MTAPALANGSDSLSFSGMHVPIKTLLQRKRMTSYDLANAFEARGLSAMAAYRLVRNEGRQARYDAKVLEALADIFAIKPHRLHELIVLDRPK